MISLKNRQWEPERANLGRTMGHVSLCAGAVLGLSVVGVDMARGDIPGACCFADGSCESYANSVACADDGGSFAGVNVTCDQAACALPESECDVRLEFTSCPETVVIETMRSEGVILDLPNLPPVRGCDPLVVVEPSLGSQLTVGENPISVIATDPFGGVAVCEFTVVVALIDESGQIPKRRIKGGGTPGAATADDGCGGSRSAPLGSLVTAATCGTCPSFGLIGALAGLVGCRRARRRSLQNGSKEG